MTDKTQPGADATRQAIFILRAAIEAQLRTGEGAYALQGALDATRRFAGPNLAAEPVEAAGAVQAAIVPDWPACNPGCDYEAPIGLRVDCRSEHCSCEPAKASVARQRATHPAEPDNEEGGPTDQLVSMLHSQRERLLEESAKLRAALSDVPAVGGALVAAPRHASGGLPVGWRDKLRRSRANTDYHGHIAFTPAQLEHFVSMLTAPAGALVAKAEPKPTDISTRLREYAANNGYSHNDYADTMSQAAEEIERYYGGMMAWKQTAEKKDRDWNEASMRFENYKCEQRAIAESAAAPAEQTQAARDVLAERRRQVEQEGWAPEHDDEHADGQMARAGACYAMWAHATPGSEWVPHQWPWSRDWWKPTDERRNLIKAAALVLAEIERLDRASPLPIPTKGNGETDNGEGA